MKCLITLYLVYTQRGEATAANTMKNTFSVRRGRIYKWAFFLAIFHFKLHVKSDAHTRRRLLRYTPRATRTKNPFDSRRYVYLYLRATLAH